MGKISVPVRYSSNDKKVLALVVVQGKRPALFGRDWLSQTRLDWKSIFKVTEHVGYAFKKFGYKCLKILEMMNVFGRRDHHQVKRTVVHKITFKYIF